MQVKSLKDLEKLIQLCQKYNIEKIEVGTVKVTIPLLAPQGQIEPIADEATQQPMTEEEILNWSTNN